MRNSQECCSILHLDPLNMNKWESLEKFWSGQGEIPEFVKELGRSEGEIDKAIAQHIVLIHLELQNWLKTSWEGTANLQYGRSETNPGRKIVIPYRAAKTPIETAEFSGKWDMINKTYQWYVSKGLDAGQRKEFILSLRNQAVNEWKHSGRSIDMEQTPMALTFKAMIAPLQLSIFQVSESDKKQMDMLSLFLFPGDQSISTARTKLKYLHEYALGEMKEGVDLDHTPTCRAFYQRFHLTLNEAIQRLMENSITDAIIRPNDAAIEAVLNFIGNTVFTGEKIYEEQIPCNSRTLCSLVKAVNGYSGTMENRMTFKPSVVHDGWEVKLDAGTQGRIVDYILKKNPPVHVTPVESPRELIDELLKNHAAPARFYAFIDTGAMFKNLSNDAIASALLDHFVEQKNSAIKGVLYYDNTTNLLMCSRAGKPPIELPATDTDTIEAITGLKKSELFVFFDHRHTRGANILLPDDAAAFITVGKDLEFDLFLQGSMRMRGLGENQTVEPIVPQKFLPALHSALQIEDKAPTIEDILLFTMVNNFSAKKAENLEAYLQMLKDDAGRFVLDILSNLNDSDEEAKIYNNVRLLFVRSLKEDLFQNYLGANKKQPVELIFSQYIDHLMEIASYACNQADKLEELKTQLNSLKQYGLDHRLFQMKLPTIKN